MSASHETRLARLEESHSETIAAMRDVTAGIAGLTAEMREANARREHIGQDVKRIEDNQRDLGKRVSSIEKNQESFRPYIEIMKQINTRMWIILMGVMGVAAMAAYKIV